MEFGVDMVFDYVLVICLYCNFSCCVVVLPSCRPDIEYVLIDKGDDDCTDRACASLPTGTYSVRSGASAAGPLRPVPRIVAVSHVACTPVTIGPHYCHPLYKVPKILCVV